MVDTAGLRNQIKQLLDAHAATHLFVHSTWCRVANPVYHKEEYEPVTYARLLEDC